MAAVTHQGSKAFSAELLCCRSAPNLCWFLGLFLLGCRTQHLPMILWLNIPNVFFNIQNGFFKQGELSCCPVKIQHLQEWGDSLEARPCPSKEAYKWQHIPSGFSDWTALATHTNWFLCNVHWLTTLTLNSHTWRSKYFWKDLTQKMQFVSEYR